MILKINPPNSAVPLFDNNVGSIKLSEKILEIFWNNSTLGMMLSIKEVIPTFNIENIETKKKAKKSAEAPAEEN